ncbi:MAG TPA: hypothetical protein VGF37_01340, partial [Chthoniobacterales bacterium]
MALSWLMVANRKYTADYVIPERFSGPGGSSAFSRCLREKGLNLLLYFSAVAAGALNPFFVVLADSHCEGETLAALFAKIFVK